MSESELTDLRERLVRLETIVGDEQRGVLSELKSLKDSVDGLKSFQLRVMGGFGALAIFVQVAVQLFFK
jgi:hypothetical protein